MVIQQVTVARDWSIWRNIARQLISQQIRPEQVMFTETEGLLQNLRNEATGAEQNVIFRVPKEFVVSAQFVACHRDADRWNLLYRLLWRLTHGEAHLLTMDIDDDVRRFHSMEKAVQRDRHKMTAFVRFRKVVRDGEDYFVAWHRPDHFIVRLTAPFFRDRFAAMNWTILTPDESVVWDKHELTFGDGVARRDAPQEDQLEELWKTYYANIFNPARIKLKAMRKEMPVRHWSTLPETQQIPDLLKQAPARIEIMTKHAGKPDNRSAADYLPEKITLPQLAEASKCCKGCDLYQHATQTVFGAGPHRAKVMFVGEQPGDQEDLAGQPFVGPAGQLLDQLMEQAKIPREEVYITNAVKHFKFEPRGKRRIHAKPNAREMRACKPWLEAELSVVKPNIVVALGATAAQTLLGPSFRLTQHRGEFFNDVPFAKYFMATYHPSALLRMPDEATREQAFHDVVGDLKSVAGHLNG